MRRLGWVAVVIGFGLMFYYCALPGDLPAQTDRSQGLAGTYTTNGVDPSGAEFSGTAIMVATDDADLFDIQLIITGSIQNGTAVRRGDVLVVTWETVAAASDSVSGTAEYVIGSDDVIRGTWRVDGFDDEGTIELFPEP